MGVWGVGLSVTLLESHKFIMRQTCKWCSETAKHLQLQNFPFHRGTKRRQPLTAAELLYKQSPGRFNRQPNASLGPTRWYNWASFTPCLEAGGMTGGSSLNFELSTSQYGVKRQQVASPSSLLRLSGYAGGREEDACAHTWSRSCATITTSTSGTNGTKGPALCSKYQGKNHFCGRGWKK